MAEKSTSKIPSLLSGQIGLIVCAGGTNKDPSYPAITKVQHQWSMHQMENRQSNGIYTTTTTIMRKQLLWRNLVQVIQFLWGCSFNYYGEYVSTISTVVFQQFQCQLSYSLVTHRHRSRPSPKTSRGCRRTSSRVNTWNYSTGATKTCAKVPTRWHGFSSPCLWVQGRMMTNASYWRFQRAV